MFMIESSLIRNNHKLKVGIIVYVYRPLTIACRGGSTLKAGCATAHPDFFEKSKEKKKIYIDVLN